MSSEQKPAHIVLVPFEAWGHVRPLFHLVIQLLTLHPQLHATLLLSPAVALRLEQEWKSANLAYVRESEHGSEILSRLQRIQVDINHVAGENDSVVEGMAAKAEAFAAAIAAHITSLLGGTPGTTDYKFKDIKPSVFIYDFFVPHIVQDIAKKLGVEEVSTFAHCPCGPIASGYMFSKKPDAYMPILLKRIADDVAAGRDPLPGIAAGGFGDRGITQHIPGLPPMTDFELRFGACPAPPQIMMGVCKAFETAWSPAQTGVIATNVEEMEHEARLWIEEHMGKPFVSVGFQYPESLWNGQVAALAAGDEDGLKTLAFLDGILEKRGPKSLVYVSFGSAWFPFMRPDIVHNLIDTLIGTSTPFLFAYATELFPVPKDLLDKIEASPFGMAVHVAPQVQVLHHAATGFFVSHCGANSMAEAIVAGVPIICAPFAADQGEYMALLKKYKAGVDLRQIKCFFGQGEPPKVLYDGVEYVGTPEAMRAEMVDVWGQLQCKLGEDLYAGMAELKKLCQTSCSEGGPSRQAMLDFAKYF